MPSGLDLQFSRGPQWLILRLSADTDQLSLEGIGEFIFQVADQHLTNRILIKFDASVPISESLENELSQLSIRLIEQGGMLRLVAPASIEFELDMPIYPDLESAVIGF